MQSLETEQLASCSGLDVNVIEALERGEHGADVATLHRVAAGLGICVAVLFLLWERRIIDVGD